MVAIDIEFEEEETKSSAKIKQEAQVDEISLEFSASTEVNDIGSAKLQDSNGKTRTIEIPTEIKRSDPTAQPPNQKTEITDEMKAAVNKVKAEAAKVRSIEDARIKKPPPASVASGAKVNTSATSGAAAKNLALEADIFNEQRNVPLLERLDPLTKVEVDAEIRIAKAEAKGEVSAFYLSEAKLLEYQIITLLKRLPPKTQEELKILQQIQKRLSDHTKKKPT